MPWLGLFYPVSEDIHMFRDVRTEVRVEFNCLTYTMWQIRYEQYPKVLWYSPTTTWLLNARISHKEIPREKPSMKINALGNWIPQVGKENSEHFISRSCRINPLMLDMTESLDRAGTTLCKSVAYFGEPICMEWISIKARPASETRRAYQYGQESGQIFSRPPILPRFSQGMWHKSIEAPKWRSLEPLVWHAGEAVVNLKVHWAYCACLLLLPVGSCCWPPFTDHLQSNEASTSCSQCPTSGICLCS